MVLRPQSSNSACTLLKCFGTRRSYLKEAASAYASRTCLRNRREQKTCGSAFRHRIQTHL